MSIDTQPSATITVEFDDLARHVVIGGRAIAVRSARHGKQTVQLIAFEESARLALDAPTTARVCGQWVTINGSPLFVVSAVE